MVDNDSILDYQEGRSLMEWMGDGVDHDVGGV